MREKSFVKSRGLLGSPSQVVNTSSPPGMASATAKGTGAIQFDFTDRYAFLIDVTYGPQGIIEA